MIKDENLQKEVLSSIDILIEVTEQMYGYACNMEYEEMFEIAEDIYVIMDMLIKILEQSEKEYKIKTCLFVKNAKYSLENILLYVKARSSMSIKKIEFELYPLLKETYQHFYFWGCLYPDKNKMQNYYENEMIPLGINPYIEESINSGEYKYELSIIVVGYNKLEYTKMCIDSLLKYIPKNLNYELILMNHGSSDGTKEYFESLSPTKQLDFKYNGGSGYVVTRIAEGKYSIGISNDVLITENAIKNMLKCISSDPLMGLVVPTTPNVSNLQTIPAQYKTIDEMYAFSKKNNSSDSFRWEQRTKLCNPISIYPSYIKASSEGIGAAYYFNDNIQSFPDDALSLRLRRKGYKLILEKDSYCYHYGSITLKDEVEEIQKNEKIDFYLEGRKSFFRSFGIDPWGTGFCYSMELFNMLECDNINETNVLGINCGQGSNPLKIKEQIKENVKNLNVNIYNITDDEAYLADLENSSDKVIVGKNPVEAIEKLSNIKFDYIILEDNLKFGKYNDKFFIVLKSKMNDNGKLIISASNIISKNLLKNQFEEVQKNDKWIIFEKILK